MNREDYITFIDGGTSSYQFKLKIFHSHIEDYGGFFSFSSCILFISNLISIWTYWNHVEFFLFLIYSNI